MGFEGFEGFEMTEEKVRKLKPIVEKILSRKHGRDIKLNNLTICGVPLGDESSNEEQQNHLPN
ncbi:hypothetical protein [Viridibacillus arvi]|uniref:hypothetical protein n=1 Tax=Viridibacillus arvi TaxID=263475 RepID=UPI003D04CFB4